MTTTLKLATLAIAGSLLGACANRTDEIGRELPPVQPPIVERVTVVQPPPVPAEEMSPAPAPSGFSWVAGHYVWQDGRWIWQPGHWRAGSVRPMPTPIAEATPPAADPNARWIPGHWSFVGNDWIWVRGHWVS